MSLLIPYMVFNDIYIYKYEDLVDQTILHVSWDIVAMYPNIDNTGTPGVFGPVCSFWMNGILCSSIHLTRINQSTNCASWKRWNCA